MEQSTTQNLDTQSLDGSSQYGTDVSASEADCSVVSDYDNHCVNDNHKNIMTAIVKPIPIHVLQGLANEYEIPPYKMKQKTIQKLVKLAEINKKLEQDLRLARKQFDQFSMEKEHFLDNQNPQDFSNLLLKYGLPIKKREELHRTKKRLMKYILENEFRFNINEADITACPEGKNYKVNYYDDEYDKCYYAYFLNF